MTKHDRDLARLHAKIQTLPSGCWLWTGAVRRGWGPTPRDIPLIRDGKKLLAAHLLAWRLYRGSPRNRVCKTCTTNRCVRPEHHVCRNPKPKKPRRIPRALRKPKSPLSAHQVAQIRTLAAAGNHTQQQIADAFRITRQAVCQIVKRRRWKDPR